jgi:hypothetical protein
MHGGGQPGTKQGAPRRPATLSATHAEGYDQNANKQSDECAAELWDDMFLVFDILRATRSFHRLS